MKKVRDGKQVNKVNNELEKWNIVYDILIDEERFGDVLLNFNGENLTIDNDKLKKGEIFPLLLNLEQENKDKTLGFYPKYSYPEINLLWLYLFLAKKVRSTIQGFGETNALKGLDEVAEYLLSKLHCLYEEKIKEDIEPEESPIDFGKKKFLVIYYNEVSQCYTGGTLNTGFAEKALKIYDAEKCHYELLSLYNRAIGLAHNEDPKSREIAIKDFNEIIFGCKKDNFGYKYKINTDLWNIYIFFPALFQKAEFLQKLQRGQESIQVLKELEEKLNSWNDYSPFKGLTLNRDYMKSNLIISWVYAELEASFSLVERETDKKIEEVEQFITANKDRKILSGKLEGLKVKTIIEKLRNKEFEEENIAVKIKEAFEKLTQLFNDVQFNQSEGIQVADYWFDLILLCIDYKLESKKEGLKFLKNNLIRPFLKILQEDWVPIKDEVINKLSKILEKAGKIKGLDMRKKEIKFLLLLSKNKEASVYKKTKIYRRLKLLNADLTKVPEHQVFNFPENLDKIETFVKSTINTDFYTQRLRYNTESFDERLIYSSDWPQLRDFYAFTILRKWQSYTPSLGSYSDSSKGGGYFVYKVNENGKIQDGIIIDPGYDFIENFFENKFSVPDIKAIVLTHSHIDHSADFRGLITLFREMNIRALDKNPRWVQRKVTVIATSCCFNHFYHTLKDSKEYIKDVIVVDPDRNPCKELIIGDSFQIKAIPACHKDLQEDSNCVGIIINNSTGEKLIAFTGDTVWKPELKNHLKDYPVVCVNMGALIDIRKGDSFEEIFYQKDSDKTKEEIKKLIYKENHLYLPGTISLLDELSKSRTNLAIVGELGEELKSGVREDLFKRFNEFFKNRLFKIAIEDIGLTVSWEGTRPYIRCTKCKKPIKSDIGVRVTFDERQNEQLYYYCKDCLEEIELRDLGVEKHCQKRYLPPARL